jgi:hypothetical protein
MLNTLHFYNHPDDERICVAVVKLLDQATSYHVQTFLTGDIQTGDSCDDWLNRIFDAKNSTNYYYSSTGNCCTATVTHSHVEVENEYLELDDISKPISLESAYITLSRWKEYLQTRNNIEFSWHEEEVKETINWYRIPEPQPPEGRIKCTISVFDSDENSGYVILPETDIESFEAKIDLSLFKGCLDLVQLVFVAPNYLYTNSIEEIADELKIGDNLISFFQYGTSMISTYIDQKGYEKISNTLPLLEKGKFCVNSDGSFYYSAVEPKTNERRETPGLQRAVNRKDKR